MKAYVDRIFGIVDADLVCLRLLGWWRVLDSAKQPRIVRAVAYDLDWRWTLDIHLTVCLHRSPVSLLTEDCHGADSYRLIWPVGQ